MTSKHTPYNIITCFDVKEGRKKQARSNKQQSKVTQHTHTYTVGEREVRKNKLYNNKNYNYNYTTVIGIKREHTRSSKLTHLLCCCSDKALISSECGGTECVSTAKHNLHTLYMYIHVYTCFNER